MSIDPSPDRRAFVICAAQTVLGITVLGSCAALAEGCSGGPTAGGSTTPITVDVTALTANGQTLVTPSAGPDNAPLLVVRQSATTFVAFSMVCTHLGCIINPPNGGIMLCPCHGAEFDVSGRAVRGPASAPLQQYSASYNATANTVTVTFV
jgi:cytochrome b6-f complex iron-sulfur subunit